MKGCITTHLEAKLQQRLTTNHSQASGEKTIANSSPRLQRLLLRLAQYDVHIEYLRGRENIIADALSHVGLLAPESQDYTTSLNNVEKIPVHQLTQIAPASTARLEELHEATTKDHQLQLLVRAVHKGWHQLFKDSPHSLKLFWTFRDEITYEDGILYKGAQLIMPKSERESTLKVIHMGHYAIEKMKLRAKETVYWPGITEDITNT